MVGTDLGFYLDAEGHVVMTFPEIETVSHVWSCQWVHTGRAMGSCRTLRWCVDGFDPTPLPNGEIPVPTEPTFSGRDILPIEPETPIKPKRNQYFDVAKVAAKSQ